MSGPYAPPKNDPFKGGSLQRLNPPSGGTFGIPPPSGGGGGSLAGNAAGGGPFFARNNRGSNVSIPYARVVPIHNSWLPRSGREISTENVGDVIRETDDLKKARLAWIMGHRSIVSDDSLKYQRGFNGFSGKGVNRSSRLCSTEYLQRIFEIQMQRVSLQLSLRYNHKSMGDDDLKQYKGGLLGTVSAPMGRYATSESKRVGSPPLDKHSSMSVTNNVLWAAASSARGELGDAQKNSEATLSKPQATQNRVEFKCGIYPRSLSPFLHGRTLLQGSSATVLQSQKGYPSRMPDALGDHVAFAALHEAMTQVGLLDWRPDGVVNSKLENGPDPAADEEYDAKDGQLFNIHVQGPAICSNWCGTEHARSLVAGDKLFVAIVADCWVNCGDADYDTEATKYKHLPQEIQTLYKGEHGKLSAAVVEAAAAKRAEILKSLAGRELNTTIEYSNQEIDNPKKRAPHLLCNFRMKYVTSSQMVETSKLAMQGKSVALRSDGSWPDGSRLGLAFSATQSGERNANNALWYSPDGGDGATKDKKNTALEWIAEFPADLARIHALLDTLQDTKTALHHYLTHTNIEKLLEGAFWSSVTGANRRIQDALEAYGSDKKQKFKQLVHDLVYDLVPKDRKSYDESNKYNDIAFDESVELRNAVTTAKGLLEDQNTLQKATKASVRKLCDRLKKGNEDYDKGIDAYYSTAIENDHLKGPPEGAALHEVVVGAWHVGTVLDTAASRGAGRGFSSNRYDSAVNMNVDVQWWSGDRLFKSYANRPGTGKDFCIRGMPFDHKTKPHKFDLPVEVPTVKFGEGHVKVGIERPAPAATVAATVAESDDETPPLEEI